MSDEQEKSKFSKLWNRAAAECADSASGSQCDRARPACTACLLSKAACAYLGPPAPNDRKEQGKSDKRVSPPVFRAEDSSTSSSSGEESGGSSYEPEADADAEPSGHTTRARDTSGKFAPMKRKRARQSPAQEPKQVVPTTVSRAVCRPKKQGELTPPRHTDATRITSIVRHPKAATFIKSEA